jgi:hypothetical protein
MPFNKLDHSTVGQIRPRFKLTTTKPKEEIMALIVGKAKEDKTVAVHSYSKFIKLGIPKKEQHTWSPVLNMTFDEENDGTLIRCLIGPEEMVWIVIMFGYIATSVLGLFASMFALVRWQLNGDSTYLFSIPLTVVVLASIFIISRIGRQKAHLQTLHILRYLRKSVDEVDCMRIAD